MLLHPRNPPPTVRGPPAAGVPNSTWVRRGEEDSAPQYRPAKSTSAPAGRASVAWLELNVAGSLSTSTNCMLKLLLSPVPALPAGVGARRIVLLTKTMSPVVLAWK